MSLQTASAAAMPQAWALGRFRFDASTRALEAPAEGAGAAVREHLPVKAAEVLLRLIASAGRVVSREQLIAEVWDGNAYTGSRALTQTVWKLRRVLDAAGDGEGAIKTISKAGYQLLLPAVPWPDAAPDLTLAEQPVPAVPPAPSPSARAGVPLIAWLAGALLLLLVAGGLWLFQHQAPTREAGAPLAEAPPPQPLTMQDGVEEYPALSPDGRRLAYIGSRSGGPTRLMLADVRDLAADPVELQVAQPGETLARPMWLAGDRIAFARARDASDCQVVEMDLASRSLKPITACFFERNLQFMDASPDGRWLALARHPSDASGVALVLRDLRSGEERLLTHPAAGMDDSQLSFSRSGRQVAFMRGNLVVGDLHVVDVATGAETRLTHDQAPVAGLSWLADDSAIVFNAARDGGFATWRIAPTGGAPTLFARLDTVTNMATMPGEPQAVAAALHRFADTVQLLSPTDGQVRATIGSSGRNLYAQACPDDGQVVFLSMRSGRIALWASDGQGGRLRQIALPPGTPDPPGCAPDAPRFATTVRAPGTQQDALIIGRLDRDEPVEVLAQAEGYNSVSWSLDGRSLLLASDRGGGWDLWRFDLQRRAFTRLTDDRGHFGREVRTPSGLWLYYARLGKPGLWRRPLSASGEAGVPEVVTDRLGSEDWANWQWHDGALWMVERGPARDSVVRRDELGRAPQVAFTLPGGQLRLYRSFSIAPNGTVVATMAGPRQADIVRLEAPTLPTH